MKILIDTNILILLEDTGRILDKNYAEMKRLCSELHWELLIHPMQYEDIARDKNDSRKEIVQSRCEQYSKLPSPPVVDKSWLEKHGIVNNSDNNKVDNALLLSLDRNAVSYFITEDRDIHRKAKRIGCDEKVLRVSQFLTVLTKRIPNKTPVPPVGISKKYLHEIDYMDPFFDSLRKSYDDFDNWYRSSTSKHREAWCIIGEEEVLGICIFKEENNPIITDSGYEIKGKVLKICTFKVGEKVRGQKYGERLLFTAFDFAYKSSFSAIYLHTHGEEHELLVSLCEDYGFDKIGFYKKDNVLVKQMEETKNLNLSSLDYSIKYYPHYQIGKSTSCFVIPIKPDYHEKLFPDISNVSKELFGGLPETYGTPARTMKKAYICHSNSRKIKQGDLIVFYRTGDRKSIEVVGIVEKMTRSQDIEEIFATISKRTVFSYKEIEKMAQKECLIILFRLQKYLERPIESSVIKALGIDGSIQTIREITTEQFCNIIRKSKSL